MLDRSSALCIDHAPLPGPTPTLWMRIVRIHPLRPVRLALEPAYEVLIAVPAMRDARS